MWMPISLDELRDLIRESEAEMGSSEHRLWELVRLPPNKWGLHPWGDEGGGFWAVGLIGDRVVWYNDIEHGFNVSRYTQPGMIEEYKCSQGSLQPLMWDLLQEIETAAAQT